MTTYGTIPTSNSQPTNTTSTTTTTTELVSRATVHIQSHLATRRPWSELFSISSLSLPPSMNVAFSRAKENLSYFRTNYAIVVLLTLFLSLLYEPVSLIVFLAMMAAWVYLYFLRDAPLVLLGRVVDDNVVLVVLGVATVLFLMMTDVTVNIVVGVAVGVVVVLVHAVFREVEDLRVADTGFEVRRGGESSSLNTASTGYTS